MDKIIVTTEAQLQAIVAPIIGDAFRHFLTSHHLPTQIDESKDRLLSVKDAAQLLGISKQTVYQNIDKIPHRKRFGRLYFFNSELLAYLSAGEGVK